MYIRSQTAPSAATNVLTSNGDQDFYVSGTIMVNNIIYASVSKFKTSNGNYQYSFGYPQSYSSRYLIVSRTSYIYASGSLEVLFMGMEQNKQDTSSILLRIARVEV
jgi:hypothetical protein